ncbi:transcriptional regulator GcvA [Stenotrophomonas tumulicola]
MKPRHPAPLNALRSFEAAARHLSFNVAARELFVTPAAVSHQVKHLEEYLGLSLFHRSHRSVALTPEGQALASTLGAVFGQIDRALDRAGSHANAELRVTTMESFAAKWLAPRLHRFHLAQPDIRVRIDTGNQHADFVRDGMDVAIRYGPGGYTGVHAELLMKAPAYPVCSPGFQRDSAPSLDCPDDLNRHPLLHDESAVGRPGVPAWADWLEEAGASKVEANRGSMFPSIYLAQEAAIAGHGIALGIDPLVREDLRQGRLVRLFPHVANNAYAFWLVQRDEAGQRPAVKAFCQWLREEAETDSRLDQADVRGAF